ncbi:MAP kinase kinase kinase [Lithohypha guttulata]|uniref:uncharacterized protein n=1 Tax=Lithohypha guttulata TaxID=1690604 RepID=UPI002DDFD6C9|nr:MAP kinase kinase kinase [Lithohypha guttulata]
MLGESARNVQLIHQSLREYLIDTIQYPEQLAHIKEHTSSSPTFEAESCHAEIATHCLSYLMRLSDGVQDAKVDEEDIEQHWPLADYAAKFWWQHLRASGSSCSRTLVELASTFLSGQYLASLRSVQLDDIDLNCAIGLADTTLYPRAPKGGIDQGPYYAAMMNLPLVMSDLLSQKPDLQLHVGYMGTAVHAAAYYGHDNIVRILLDAGANPANHNSFHGSALDLAAFRGRESIVRMLLAPGASVNSKGGSRYTALTAACSHGHLEIVSLLLAAGADVHALDRTGRSALVIAVRAGHKELVKMLLNAGANVNKRDYQQTTALMWACYHRHSQTVLQLAIVEALRGHSDAEDIIKLLLDHKVDAPYDRRTLLGNGLCTAAEHRNGVEALKAIALLLAYGADPLFVRESPGPFISPIDIAQQSAHSALVDLLRKAVVDMAPSIDISAEPAPDTATATATATTAGPIVCDHAKSINSTNETTLPDHVPDNSVEPLYEAEKGRASGCAEYAVEGNAPALPQAAEDEFSSLHIAKAHAKASFWRRTRDKLKDKVRKGSASGNNR